MSESAPAVITEYRNRLGENGKPLPYRKFIAEINKQLPFGIRYTHTTLIAWERGKFAIPADLLFTLSKHATGWVRDFALDALAAIDADVERRR